MSEVLRISVRTIGEVSGAEMMLLHHTHSVCHGLYEGQWPDPRGLWVCITMDSASLHAHDSFVLYADITMRTRKTGN